MNSYGYYFPSYTTMLPLYSSFLGGYGLTGGSTRKSSSSSKSKRQKWEENQNRYSGQQSAEDNERANKSTTLGKEFTSGDGRDGFGGGFGGSSSGKGNSAGSSNQGHGYTDKAAMDAMTQGLADMGLSAAAKAGLAMGIGAPTNAALGFGLSGTPGALGATAGKAAAAAMGMTTGTTTGAMLGGLLGSLAGPIGGLLGGLVGPALGGLVADALGMRDEEATRDSFEDAFGTITGRQIGAAYAGSLAAHNQDMATINDISLAQAMNDAIADSKSLSDQAKTNAMSAVTNSIGFANPTSSWGRSMVGPVASTYAGAMASLGDLGKDTGSAADEASPVGGFASTGQFGGIGTDNEGFGTGIGGPTGGGAMSHGKAQDNFGGIGGFGDVSGPGLSGIGGVTGETAADTAASTSAAESDTAGGTATGGDTSGGASSSDSGTTGEGGASEGNDGGDNGNDGGDGGEGGEGGGDSGGGSGPDGGMGSDSGMGGDSDGGDSGSDGSDGSDGGDSSGGDDGGDSGGW